MKNKRRIFGITAVLLAVVLISAAIFQRTRDAFAYTNTSAKTSRTFENGWATVSVNCRTELGILKVYLFRKSDEPGRF